MTRSTSGEAELRRGRSGGYGVLLGRVNKPDVCTGPTYTAEERASGRCDIRVWRSAARQGPRARRGWGTRGRGQERGTEGRARRLATGRGTGGLWSVRECEPLWGLVGDGSRGRGRSPGQTALAGRQAPPRARPR